MAKVVRFQLNHAGMAELLKSDAVRATVTPYAERTLAAAKADPHDETGEYEAGLRIEQDTIDRVAVRVKGTDWKSGILEAKYGILQRALGSAS